LTHPTTADKSGEIFKLKIFKLEGRTRTKN
jgi:hypothetical protein